MIIIEGPDGAGKTTLARRLAHDFQLQLSPHSQLPPEERKKLKHRNQREFVYGAIADALRGNQPVYIHDRIFYSALVYQPILDDHVPFESDEIILIRQVLRAMGVPTVMCMPPFEQVEQNVNDSDQLEGVKPHIGAIYDAYASMTFHNTVWYDYTGERTGNGSYVSYEILSDLVERYLERRRERSWS